MPATVMHDAVTATLKRLEKKDPGLKRLLQKAHGYAVFPSVGKAAAVLGGSYGRGEVFEKGKPIGHATIAQFTVGVQLGGDTFTEVIVFESRQALDRFKQGKVAFAANASAVLVKAGAAAANNFNRGVAVFAYSEGGMLLEAAIGGQKFKFKPSSQPDGKQGQGQGQSAKSGKGQQGRAEASDEGEEEEDQDEGAEEREGEGSDEAGDGTGFMGRALGGVKGAASGVGGMARQHPVYATIIGAGVVTGLALLIARSVRGSSGGAEEDEGADGQEESEDENEGPEASAEDEGEDSGEEEEQEDDGGDEEEDEPRFMKRGRARA